MLAHASMTPGKIEQKEHTDSLQPRGWLRTVNFKIAAVRAGVVHPDFKHYKIPLFSAVVPGVATPANPQLLERCNRHVRPRNVLLAPGLILFLMEMNMAFALQI